MISRVAKVYLAVDDQESAVDFWRTTMGFRVHRDVTFGDDRWIEIQPPDQELGQWVR